MVKILLQAMGLFHWFRWEKKIHFMVGQWLIFDHFFKRSKKSQFPLTF